LLLHAFELQTVASHESTSEPVTGDIIFARPEVPETFPFHVACGARPCGAFDTAFASGPYKNSILNRSRRRKSAFQPTGLHKLTTIVERLIPVGGFYNPKRQPIMKPLPPVSKTPLAVFKPTRYDARKSRC
jgi:hypothetical protein